MPRLDDEFAGVIHVAKDQQVDVGGLTDREEFVNRGHPSPQQPFPSLLYLGSLAAGGLVGRRHAPFVEILIGLIGSGIAFLVDRRVSVTLLVSAAPVSRTLAATARR